MVRYFRIIVVVFISVCASCQSAETENAAPKEEVIHETPGNPQPVPVIFDSDMGPDYDDVGAIALLHAFADEGQAKILATIASTKYEGVAEVFDVFNTYFKKPDIPVGVPTGEASTLRDEQHWSDTIRSNYPHSIKSNKDASDAVELYRKILSQQPDTSVTIITVGFLTNISNLLKSSADQYSPLTGNELVDKKVKKLVSMAGMFPEGSEYNIKIDAAASQYVFENFSRPVIFSGFEIGKDIRTGLPLIADKNIVNSPVKDVFRISIPMNPEDSAGRMSWDETAVLIGIKGHEPHYSLEAGQITVDSKGYNKWNTEKKNHAYLVVKTSPGEVQDIINKLMMHQPSR